MIKKVGKRNSGSVACSKSNSSTCTRSKSVSGCSMSIREMAEKGVVSASTRNEFILRVK